MPHELSIYAFELPAVEEWFAGDDRALEFQVVDENDAPVDISGATISWGLFERAYQTDPADAVLDGSDSGVEIVTDSRTDTANGQFEVRLTGDATADLWGEFFHRPDVEQSDGTEASWRGPVYIEA
jgi:hypothetical protein